MQDAGFVWDKCQMMVGCFGCLLFFDLVIFLLLLFFLMPFLLFSLQLAVFILTELPWSSPVTCLPQGLKSFWTRSPILSLLSFGKYISVYALTSSGDQVSSPVLCPTSKMTPANT